MTMVIELDDDIYTRLFDNGDGTSLGDAIEIGKALRNGTPLPKEYGRLIEAEKLKDSIMTITRSVLVNSVESALGMALYKISNAPTIIEGTEVGNDRE